MSHDTCLILGAGAFGTSIASVLSHNFKRVIMLVRSQDIYESINAGENKIYLPDQKLSPNIKAALTWDEIDEVAGKVELIVNGLPTSAITSVYTKSQERIEKYLSADIPLVSLSKGIDSETLTMADEMLNDIFPHHADQILYLSGPSFAKEIVDKQITIVSLAGRSRTHLEQVCVMMQTPYFKVFPTYDIKGVLLGGALKNIMAIAGGIIEGLGYNHNTRAAMITRGIVEMLRFGVVFNARPETFYGLSGMGDLILTTTGGLSRNLQFGHEIAKGRKAIEIINSQRSVVEGYKTTLAAKKLADKYQIRTTIFSGMYKVLYEDCDAQELIKEIMRMPSKFAED